jgi:hypothetical protein
MLCVYLSCRPDAAERAQLVQKNGVSAMSSAPEENTFLQELMKFPVWKGEGSSEATNNS